MVDCNKCFKNYNSTISTECSLCQKYRFHENIFCDLWRSSLDNKNIECFAYKPNISVVGENKDAYESDRNSNKEVKSSERQKWLKAYALQQLKFSPDQIFSNLNYHLCLVTEKREKLFENIDDKELEFSSIFTDAGDQFNGNVSFLCSGVDHIHLHIDSPPDYSVDEVVNKILLFIEPAIKNGFPKLFKNQKNIFLSSYFIESIG